MTTYAYTVTLTCLRMLEVQNVEFLSKSIRHGCKRTVLIHPLRACEIRTLARAKHVSQYVGLTWLRTSVMRLLLFTLNFKVLPLFISTLNFLPLFRPKLNFQTPRGHQGQEETLRNTMSM